jgi:hypothetical protein
MNMSWCIVVAIFGMIAIKLFINWIYEWYDFYLDHVREDLFNHNELFFPWLMCQLFAEKVYVNNYEDEIEVDE